MRGRFDQVTRIALDQSEHESNSFDEPHVTGLERACHLDQNNPSCQWLGEEIRCFKLDILNYLK